MMRSNYALVMLKNEPLKSPRARNTVPCPSGTSNKSLDTYSLKGTGAVGQRVTANGQNWGLNGSLRQRVGLGGTWTGGYLLHAKPIFFAKFGKLVAHSWKDCANRFMRAF